MTCQIPFESILVFLLQEGGFDIILSNSFTLLLQRMQFLLKCLAMLACRLKELYLNLLIWH